MRRTATAVCVVMALAGAAAGDPPPGDPPKTEARPLTPDEMLVAGDALAMLFIAMGTGFEWHVHDCTDCDTAGGYPMFIMGVPAYVAIAPYTHAKAGHPVRALASGAVRLAMPIGALVLADKRDWGFGATAGVTTGAMLAAIAFDWFVISRAGSSHDYAPFSVYVAPTTGGAIAGIGGSL